MSYPSFLKRVSTDGSASRSKEPPPCRWNYANRDRVEGAVPEEIHLVALKAAWGMKLVQIESLESEYLGLNPNSDT